MKRSRFVASSAASAAAIGFPLTAFASADMTLTTPTGKLAGTLEMPATPGAPPVVLIIAGSGPTDRDGNSPLLPGKCDTLKLLALGLASRGIASLRYDKRAIAASAGAAVREEDLRFDTYVDDATRWIAALREQRRFSRVVVAGHSEGSLVGMLAAVRANADGYVSLDGAGRPMQTVLREQFSAHGADAVDPGHEAGRILDELIAGRTVRDVPPGLMIAFRPSVQPYLISWFKYDPAHEIAAVRVPAAIVHGTADVQVKRVDADELHAGLPSARFVMVEGMNHVLKHAPDTSTPTAIVAGYSDPSLPVEPVVIDTVAAIALRRT